MIVNPNIQLKSLSQLCINSFQQDWKKRTRGLILHKRRGVSCGSVHYFSVPEWQKINSRKQRLSCQLVEVGMRLQKIPSGDFVFLVTAAAPFCALCCSVNQNISSEDQYMLMDISNGC